MASKLERRLLDILPSLRGLSLILLDLSIDQDPFEHLEVEPILRSILLELGPIHFLAGLEVLLVLHHIVLDNDCFPVSLVVARSLASLA